MFQFALAISLTETCSGLDAIKSRFGAGSGVKVLGIGARSGCREKLRSAAPP